MSRIKALFSKCAGFSGGLISGNAELPQLLILGLDKAGKTTLLYRLKIGSGWGDIVEDMKKMRTPDADGKVEDPGYHYEELNRSFACGVWEVPGTEAMRPVWKLFYQSIKIHCVVFVVDANDSEQRINMAKRHLHVLMNEDGRRVPRDLILGAEGRKVQTKLSEDCLFLLVVGMFRRSN
ncbi:ARF1 [Symbiodinium sp. CCMP2592]|nr:ARF1 [Symbiodinium sp. CCMP2592]